MRERHGWRREHGSTGRPRCRRHGCGSRRYARAAAAAGAVVDVNDINADAAESVAAGIVESGGRALCHPAGLQGWPYAAAYAAAKGGLVTLMKTLAIEYGPAGVRVNLVAPGSVDTGMSASMRVPDFPYDESIRKRNLGLAGRRADPVEIAELIAFLASDKASYVTGTVLQADGGAFA